VSDVYRTPDERFDDLPGFGFVPHYLDQDGLRMHYLDEGEGDPLLLLHGYPQTGAMWHAVAPELAQRRTVVVADLTGYGASSKPATTEDHEPYSKRGMARHQVAAMRALGFERFERLVTRYGRITTVSAHEVAVLQRWFERFGSVLVLVGRVIPAVRTAISIPAGLVRMPFARFLVLSIVGILISAGILAWLGWLLKDHYTAIEHYAGPVSTGIVAAAALLWFTRLVLQLVKNRRG
jgi:pimeloyl-ACP methyl ester carboxylesterase